MISIDPCDIETEPLPVINLSKWTGRFRSGIAGPYRRFLCRTLLSVYPWFRPFQSNIEYDRNVIKNLAEQIPKKFEVKKVFKSARAIDTFKNRHPIENGRIYFDKILHSSCFLFKKTKRTQVKVDKTEFEFPNMSLYEIMAQKMNVTLTEFGPFVASLLKPNDLLSITYWMMSHTYDLCEWKRMENDYL